MLANLNGFVCHWQNLKAHMLKTKSINNSVSISIGLMVSGVFFVCLFVFCQLLVRSG